MSLLNRTTLAATRFFDGNGLHLRVYFQYSTDDIKESFWDQAVGWNIRGDGSVVNAKLNSPIAVVSWAAGTQVRPWRLSRSFHIPTHLT
jgi:Fungal fucose-specific lectin